ncbi:hypothetical protein AGMMS49975_02600 [Clostridia bacterium]|nr:hypothetical protein AGMMS49975_02600 [Clostridia bacterium]
MNKKIASLFLAMLVGTMSMTSVYAKTIKAPAEAKKPTAEVSAPKDAAVIENGYLFLKDEYPTGKDVVPYKQALDEAIKNNSSLAALEDSVRVVDQTITLNNDSFMLSASSGISTPQVISILTTLKSMQNNQETKPLTETMLKDSTESMLLTTITGIESQKIDLQVLEENIALSEENIKNLELQKKAGVVSENSLKLAKISLDSSKANRDSLKLSLDSKHTALDALLGKSLTNKIQVEYRPNESKIDTARLEATLNDAVDNSPTVKAKVIALRGAKYDKDITTYDTPSIYNPTGMTVQQIELNQIQLENAVKDADRDLKDTRSSTEQGVRNLIDNVKQLEAARVSLDVALETAKNAYDTALLNYKAGNIIKYQVDQARIGVLKAESDIEKNKISYDQLRFLAEKPYLAAMTK